MSKLLQMFTIQRLAEQLGVCTRTVERAVWSGELPFHRVGRRVLISEADAAIWMAGKRVAVTPNGDAA